MLKILLKIWIAIVPVLIYLIWVFVSTIIIAKIRNFARKIAGKGQNSDKNAKKSKKNDFIDAKYKIIDENSDKNGDFLSKISFSNKNLVISLYLGLFLLILSLVFGVFLEKENHTQSTIEDLKERVRTE